MRRLRWQNAACAPAGSIHEQVAKATGIVITTHLHAGTLVVSSCTVTLIDADLVITAAHCINESEVPSASVTFDFQTNCDGTRPMGYSPRFHKVKRIVRNGGNLNVATDWLILQLETPPGGMGIAPRPLRSSATMAGETIFTAHHPNGAVKKIQQGVLTSGTANDVRTFDFAGGSSGSALFDASGNIIGAALSQGPISATSPTAAAVRCSTSWRRRPRRRRRSTSCSCSSAPAHERPRHDHAGHHQDGRGGGRGAIVRAARAHRRRRLHGHGRIQHLGDASAQRCAESGHGRAQDHARHRHRGARAGRLDEHRRRPAGGDGIAPGGAAPARGPADDRRRAQHQSVDRDEGEAALGNTQLAIVGFGTEANLDGPRLTTLARNHGGIYTHTSQGLALKKFFSLSFGNIFESGMLADPEFVLPRDVRSAKPESFQVCEERITAVIGWNDPSQPLDVLLRTPGGTVINAATAGVQSGRGQTWQYLRVALPFGGEREGTWQWEVHRVVTSKFMNFGEVRYFLAVIADGGPKFQALPQRQRIYTGDPVNPLVWCCATPTASRRTGRSR